MLELRPNKVYIYDTTLRDGEQGVGVDLSTDAKLKIATHLDPFVDYIEGGFAGANNTDREFFRRAAAGELDLKRAKLAVFGATRRHDNYVESDENIHAMLAAETPVITFVAKARAYHVEKVLKTSEEQNLLMIEDTVRYLRAETANRPGQEIGMDAEQFFDGYKENPSYALECLRRAAVSGINWITLCDTNGGTMYWDIEHITALVVSDKQIRESGVLIGIHTHNDSELAVANSLAGIRGGARQVQGTINGYGERIGNSNLISIMAILKLKMGIDCLSDEQATELTSLAGKVAFIARRSLDPSQPFVGDNAFYHKAGQHVNAISKDPVTFEHITPESVGNHRQYAISKLGGYTTVDAAFKQEIRNNHLLYSLNPEHTRDFTNAVKDHEDRGFRFNQARASFLLLGLSFDSKYQPAFRLQHSPSLPEAKVVIDRDKDRSVEFQFNVTCPTDQVFNNFKQYLEKIYPELEDVTLLSHYTEGESRSEQGELRRVFIRAGNQRSGKDWTTVGIGPDLATAQTLALRDVFEYALLPNH